LAAPTRLLVAGSSNSPPIAVYLALGAREVIDTFNGTLRHLRPCVIEAIQPNTLVYVTEKGGLNGHLENLLNQF
jgi:hypothetical protein